MPAEGVLHDQAGDVFQDLILMRLDTMSLPALKMAAMQR
jgi:hypothetical protein